MNLPPSIEALHPGSFWHIDDFKRAVAREACRLQHEAERANNTWAQECPLVVLSTGVGPLDELAEYLREQTTRAPFYVARNNRWLSALERTRQDARRYGVLRDPTSKLPPGFHLQWGEPLDATCDAILAKDAL